MITWEELLKNRVPVASTFNSAHMLECISAVQKVYSDALIVQVSMNSWKLMDGEKDLSHAHNSHYACWAEAEELIRVASE